MTPRSLIPASLAPSIRLLTSCCLLAALAGCTTTDPITRSNAANASAHELTARGRTALADLYARDARARALGSQALAVLVFPDILRGGFMIGGQAGNGVLFNADSSVGGFYQSTAVSYGFQIGLERFGYALFLMDSASMAALNASGGWEVGGSPSLTVVDQGVAASVSTTTLRTGTYAAFFNQRGLMAGLSLQGTKITRLQPAR